MIIYHGKRKWNQKEMYQFLGTNLSKELHIFVPEFKYHLTNLQMERQEDIRMNFASLSLQMGFLMMKSIREEELLDKLEEIFVGMEKVIEEEKGKDYVQQLFVYLYFGLTIEKSIVMGKAFDISSMAGILPISPGAQIFREGKAEGKAEGMEFMLQFFIEKMLQKGYKSEFIAELLDMPVHRIIAISNNINGKDKPE